MKRLCLVVRRAGIVLLACVITACSGSAGDMVSQDQMSEMVAAEMQVLSWPGQIPEVPAFWSQEPEGDRAVTYEPGVAAMSAEIYNICAWYRAWLDVGAADRPELLVDLRQTIRSYDLVQDNEEKFVTDWDEMELGDASPAQSFYDNNVCVDIELGL